MALYSIQLNSDLPISILERRPAGQKFHGEVKVLNQLMGLQLYINRSYNMMTSEYINSTLTSVRDIRLGLNRSQERRLAEWRFDLVISDVSITILRKTAISMQNSSDKTSCGEVEKLSSVDRYKSKEYFCGYNYFH